MGFVNANTGDGGTGDEEENGSNEYCKLTIEAWDGRGTGNSLS